MQMKQILLIGFLFFFPWLAGAGSYTSLLRQMGMENIREVADPEGVYLCWEDPVYRGPVRGLAEILRTLAVQEDLVQDTHLVILENGLPQIRVKVSAADWADYREERISWADFVNRLLL